MSRRLDRHRRRTYFIVANKSVVVVNPVDKGPRQARIVTLAIESLAKLFVDHVAVGQDGLIGSLRIVETWSVKKRIIQP